MASITWNSTERDKVRLLAGIETEELDNSKLDILLNMSVDWFEQQTGLTYTLGGVTAYDNAVVYYTCYLASLVQNGVGIDSISLGDVKVSYNNAEFQHFEDLALEMLLFKLGLSIQKTTYNASPYLGQVNWNKNITGADSTKNIRKVPRGLNYK
tara:strand:- start:1664 stop:2125 length:462 start_codon:yes stop_codon:yes gene_type:complete